MHVTILEICVCSAATHRTVTVACEMGYGWEHSEFYVTRRYINILCGGVVLVNINKLGSNKLVSFDTSS